MRFKAINLVLKMRAIRDSFLHQTDRLFHLQKLEERVETWGVQSVRSPSQVIDSSEWMLTYSWVIAETLRCSIRFGFDLDCCKTIDVIASSSGPRIHTFHISGYFVRLTISRHEFSSSFFIEQYCDLDWLTNILSNTQFWPEGRGGSLWMSYKYKIRRNQSPKGIKWSAVPLPC